MAFEFLAPLIATELRDLSAETEALAMTLCADANISSRHLELLQSFDLIAQRQAELADLLPRLASGTDAQTALRSVRLSELAERLAKAA